ncbi:MAG: class I SAM-dependent methyltransferase [Candidatus Bathyarchaeia archaeon]
MPTKLDVKQYWEKRLSNCFSLEGVGCLGMGERYNWYLYKSKNRVMNRTLKKLHLSTRNKTVLDVGSGTGFWINYYLKKDIRNICGCDISSVSVRNLKTIYSKYDNVSIFEADFGSRSIPVDVEFDIVNAMDVAYHILDDDGFTTFIDNISGCLRSGGYVFLTDTFPERPRDMRYPHVKNRTLSEYNEGMERNGIRIIMVTPMYFLLHPPADGKPSPTLLGLIYEITQRVYRRKYLGLVYLGTLYMSDSILTYFQNLSFSLELIVGRKM